MLATLLPSLTLAVAVAWAMLTWRAVLRRRRWRGLVRWGDALRRGRLLARAPLLGLGAEREAGPVVLRGVLRQRGPGVGGWVMSGEGRTRRGTPLAGRPIGASGSELRREHGLELEDGTVVALAPPLRVVVGSKQQFGTITLRWLYGGDRVLALGVLRGEDRTRDYRTGAEQGWTLEPLGDAVLLASESAASAAEPARATSSGELAASRDTTARGSKGDTAAGPDASLGLSAACVGWGSPRWAVVALLAATLGTALWHAASRAQRSREQRCAAELACEQAGLCGAVWSGGVVVCGATHDAHCEAAAVCREQNRCRAVDGVCAPLDCKRPCETNGACVPQGTTCVAVSEEDCGRSWNCEHSGLCTLRGGRCVLTADGRRDCSSSPACSYGGHCTSTPKGCLAVSRQDCERSKVCEERGRCSPDAVGICRALSDADCKGSRLCREWGFCTAVEGGCALSHDDTCGASTECDYRGKCEKVGKDCVPTRKEHCESALICVTHEQCRVADQQCVK